MRQGRQDVNLCTFEVIFSQNNLTIIVLASHHSLGLIFVMGFDYDYSAQHLFYLYLKRLFHCFVGVVGGSAGEGFRPPCVTILVKLRG